MFKNGTSLKLISLIALFAAAPLYTSLAQSQTGITEVKTTPELKRGEPIKELTKTDLSIGTGQEAVNGKTVTVNHTGWLFTFNPAKPDHKGSKIDDYLESGPAKFELGAGKMLKGWELGIVGMKVGGKRVLIVPSEYAYGVRGMGRGIIPPNAVLIYEIELVNVK